MASMIQIRNVPDAPHCQIKARAALEGKSMSLYILRQVERALEWPTRRELLEAIQKQAAVRLDHSPADVVRGGRNARDLPRDS